MGALHIASRQCLPLMSCPADRAIACGCCSGCNTYAVPISAPQVAQNRQHAGLNAALRTMACRMMEAGVIRQAPLEQLLGDETVLLAASAAEDR